MPSRSFPDYALERCSPPADIPTDGALLGGSRRFLFLLMGSVLLASLLSGCAALVVGGAVAGASAIYDRRPYHVFIDDEQIELTAMHALQQDPAIQGHSGISVTSYNHTVLLTGQAESARVARLATNRVSRLPKVARVVDEITIGPTIGIEQESQDVYLTSRAKLALAEIDLPEFNATRIKVVTEDGVVYLMGLVSPAEADAATEKVRYVPGVKRVVKLFEYR